MICTKGGERSCRQSWRKRGAAVAVSLIANLGFLAGSSSGQSPAVPPPPDVVARAKATLPQHTGTLTLRSVQQPVEVIRDKWGVPHIYSQSTHDLFFAQGLEHLELSLHSIRFIHPRLRSVFISRSWFQLGTRKRNL